MATDPSHDAAPIEIVAAVICDTAGNVLVVRKRGSDTFIQPGGKPEPGEAPLLALARELHEELGVQLDAASAVPLGQFEAWAVHEPGRRVRAQAWRVQVIGTPQPRAEIAALAWVPMRPPHGQPLAALSADHILPAAARAVATGWSLPPANPGHRMSSPPQLPDTRPPVDPMAPPKFLSPMLKSVLLVCVVSALSWLVTALMAVPLSRAAWVQELLHDNDLSWISPSLQWLGAHALGICVAMLLTCLVGVVACLGMLRREAWALWLFIVLLVATALSNFAAAWVVDDAFSHLLAYLDSDAANTAMRELRPDVLLQRIVFVGTALGTSLAFAILHGWLVLRLLRADVQAYFRR